MEMSKLQTKDIKVKEGSDPNYLAVIVKCPKSVPHPNAERLELIEIFGNTTVVGKNSFKEGDVLCYFPVESCISRKFLSWANLLDDKELNSDGVTVGYFGKQSRVKAIKLRGIASQGFLFKASELARYYKVDESIFKVGDVFNVVGDDLLVSKYVKGTESEKGGPNVKKSRVPAWLDKTISVFPRPIRRTAYIFVNSWFNRDSESIKSRIVEGQFQYHYKTEHLGKNVFILKPEDEITITSKVHGTSAIYGNLKCKLPFNPVRSIVNALGGKIPTTEHKLIYSSRSVVKNRKDGKYTDDVWGVWADVLKDQIPPGTTVYGEIAGFTSTGKMIQKGYDYGCVRDTCMFYVYRITDTLADGKKREFSFEEIQNFCNNHELKTVPVYYDGMAKNLFPEIPLDENWNNAFLSKLKETYLDKICEFCTTGVVREGIVLKINSRESKPVFKFKSPAFLVKESADRDKGEVDMEEDN